MMIPTWLTEKVIEGVITLVGKVIELVMRKPCPPKEKAKR